MSPKAHAELPAGTPRIVVGLQFTVRRGAFAWRWNEEEVRIPVGTAGEVVPWLPGCAVRFSGIQHPKFDVFPMELTFPGRSEVPDWMDVTGMRKTK